MINKVGKEMVTKQDVYAMNILIISYLPCKYLGFF